MRIIHLSDLHFGTETQDLQRDLLTNLQSNPADLVIVSGDFTQTGGVEEFQKAREFLDQLEVPVFCVPGNHDIPRYALIRRLLNPYARYQRYISKSLFPMWCRKGVCAVGVNTARRILPHWNWANGAISLTQLTYLENFFWAHPGDIKICVMHHPIHKVLQAPLKTVVFGGERAMKAILDLKIDLVLTGHVHHASITIAEEAGHKTFFLSASTALSSRVRMQKNGYNVITIKDRVIDIDILVYENGSFTCLESLHQEV